MEDGGVFQYHLSFNLDMMADTEETVEIPALSTEGPQQSSTELLTSQSLPQDTHPLAPTLYKPEPDTDHDLFDNPHFQLQQPSSEAPPPLASPLKQEPEDPPSQKSPTKLDHSTPSSSPTKNLSPSPSPGLTKKISIKDCQIHLLVGQDLFIRDSCLLMVDSDTRISGYLLVTNYRMIFTEGAKVLIDLPLGYINTVERTAEQKPVVSTKIQIFTKFNRVYRLRFISSLDVSNKVYRVLRKFTGTELVGLFATPFFSFVASQSSGSCEGRTGEWRFDIEKEYRRMGVEKGEDSPFRWVDNTAGKLVASYPPHFIITKKIKDQTLQKCLKIRARSRVPTLSYFHIEEKTQKFSCLWRASQCKNNWQPTRNLADQQYVKCLSIHESKRKSLMLLVYDVGVKTNTPPVYYQNSFIKNVSDLVSLPLLKQSFYKVADVALNDTHSKWLGSYEDSKWSEQTMKLLRYAEEIALKMKNGNPVLVQCREGYDRSAQLSILVQLILCPYYRTFEGFSVLFTKELQWLGYPFADRLRSRGEQQVPSLIQLLDCIHQLTLLFPLSFEFTDKYLTFLAHHLYDNKFGDFLCNSYNESISTNIKERTFSFWSKPLSSAQKNPFYHSSTSPRTDHPTKNESASEDCLLPLRGIDSLPIWGDYFFKLDHSENRDQYRTNPEAQDNRDYLGLQHWSVRHEILQLEMLLDEQKQVINTLTHQLKTELELANIISKQEV